VAGLGVLLYFGRRHPTIVDPRSIGAGRKKLAWLTLAIFLLCFTPAPLEENPDAALGQQTQASSLTP